ncbi:bifunctional metallophosphatase/5'-nucleotidase [Nocardioides aurantiacus]|uniref:5'-nucleotidase n=1 Tax=Nocardioides aurantiacus TaxID=86796 RepID=A0A3N2CRC4_9ACTN|nr:bifunctional metallophosphatase/5'-nucleotidase [Nocardioides aurantiacus]ROR90085.1 5'-nucleotidase [Nocardioides aurantiacus]
MSISTPKRRLTGALASAAVALGALAPLALGASTADAAPVTAKPAKPTKPAKPAKPGKPDKPGRYVPVQLLSFNDFHGNLEPPSGSSGRNTTGYTPADPKAPVAQTTDAGGAEYLATRLAQAREGHPQSLTVAAGDLIGASPLLSAAFHDEPAVESLNKLGLDVSAVGNHEFDEGYQELQRMARGGCLDDGAGEDNQDSCPAGTFAGADFDYLAANVRYAGTNETILPPYAVKQVGAAKIGFIGMTLEETPDIVTASGVAGLEFDDEVKAANALVPVLRKQGVNAVVVLIHQGGTPRQLQLGKDADGKPYSVAAPYDYTCAKGGALEDTSPILPIAKNLDPAIDMVVSGHTHNPYVCDVKDPAGQDRLVTSASSFGRLVTETNLTYDKASKDIVRASVEGANLQVTRDVPKDRAQTALIAKYKELVRPIASRVLGSIGADVTRTPTTSGESALGDLIADAQLADDSVVTGGDEPVIAFMNPGGIRADLTRDKQTYGEQVGEVTYGEAFDVQPFNNFLVSMTLTGQQVYDVLTQQVTGANAASRKVLQVSEGFEYRLGSAGPVDGSVTLDGEAIDKAATYRIVTNNFLADGGDGFPAFKGGTGIYYGGLDIDAFADYLEQNSPYTPATPDRILPAG